MYLTPERIPEIVNKPKWSYIIFDVVLKRMVLYSPLLSIFNIVKLIISRLDYHFYHFSILFILPVFMYSFAGILMGIYEWNVSAKCSSGLVELNAIKKKFSYILIEYLPIVFLPCCLLTAFSPENLWLEILKV